MTFIWLSLVEFAQERLGLGDRELMSSPFRAAKVHRFHLRDRKVVYDSDLADADAVDANRDFLFRLYLMLAPGQVQLIRDPDAPVCDWHGQFLDPAGLAAGNYEWECSYEEYDEDEKKNKRKSHVMRARQEGRRRGDFEHPGANGSPGRGGDRARCVAEPLIKHGSEEQCRRAFRIRRGRGSRGDTRDCHGWISADGLVKEMATAQRRDHLGGSR